MFSEKEKDIVGYCTLHCSQCIVESLRNSLQSRVVGGLRA